MSADLGDRATYLGASDIAAVIGISPYLAPVDLWLQKTRHAESVQTEAMLAGSVLEDSIVALYEARTGYRTQRRTRPLVHPEHPFIQGHVDRLIVNEPGGMDAKASAYGPGYGAPGTDEVPPHVRTQMEVYMGLSGRAWWDVALLRNLRLDIFRVEHDPELSGQLVAVAVDFWQEHVVKGVPPEVDGTAGYRRFLSARFPEDDGLEMVATPEVALLVDDLAAIRAEAKALDARQSLIENRIRDAMGAASVLHAPGGKVTWRMQQGSTYTVERKPGRVFRFAPAKASEEAA